MEYDKLKNKIKHDSCVYPLPIGHVLRTVSSDSEVAHIAIDSDDGLGKENLCGKKGRYMRVQQRNTEMDEICGDCIRIAGYFEKEDVSGLNIRYIDFLDKVKIEERSEDGDLMWYQYLDKSKARDLGVSLSSAYFE